MDFASHITCASYRIGPGESCFVIAEISANHDQKFEKAKALVLAAKESGADAVKFQTYHPDTITFNSDAPAFQVDGTIWAGQSLYALYEKAYMPWEWHEALFKYARELGLVAFSSPFDLSAVDFLQDLDIPVWKIASSELVDIPLLKKVATTDKPVILSTGMADRPELEEALATLHQAGCRQLALLKCTAAYPARAEDANLATIPDMQKRYGCPVGLSDHTRDLAVPLMALGLGGCVVEKHLTLERTGGGIDSAFSLEPAEFRELVRQLRLAEAARGQIRYAPSDAEQAGRKFRRSLYAVSDIQAGEIFSPENIRSLRPADGLHTRHYETLLGQISPRDIQAGTPLGEKDLECVISEKNRNG